MSGGGSSRRRDGHAPSNAKVFGIGLDKTGLTSLHQALEELGYTTARLQGPETELPIFRALDEGWPLLHYLDAEADAVAGILALSSRFFIADVQYPGSKFILTVRDLADWLASRRRQVEKNRELQAAGIPHTGFLSVDVDAWGAHYEEHEAVVRAYFADRPDDLLVFDLVGGDGWEPLCEFLGLPTPEASFPHARQGQTVAPPPGGVSPESAETRR
jgi:hypothetical protein